MPIDLATYRSMIGRWQARMLPRPATTPTTVRARPLSVATVLELCVRVIPLIIVSLHVWGSSLYTAAWCSTWHVSKVIIEGRWLSHHSVCKVSRVTCRGAPLLLRFSMVVMVLLLLRGGDVETNPGPETQLKLDDLGSLKKLLQPVSAYWVPIADQLGMTSQVPIIQTTPANTGPPAFLRDLLLRWLSRDNPSPTLEALCQALRDDEEIIGGAIVAKKLEEKFQGQPGLLSREGVKSSIPQAPSVGLVSNQPRMAPMRSTGRGIRRGLPQAPGVRGAHGPRIAQLSETQNSSQRPGMGSSQQPPQHQAQIAVDSGTNETQSQYPGVSSSKLPGSQHLDVSSCHFQEQCMPEHPEETNRRVRCYYANLLRDKYHGGIPSFLSLQWPPPPTKKVFNLAMVTQKQLRYGPNEEMVKLLLRGDVRGATYGKDKMTLERISASLHPRGRYSRGRKIFLIEGAPGAGKSTMAWHMCQMWEMGQLFEEFEIVLFVQLRDPAIQSAQSFDDLFPDDLNMKSEVVHAVQHCGGRNVLIVLDGWDEFPPGLDKNSIIRELICNPSSLKMQFSALIITSRPIATAELQRFATSRIEIIGFMRSEIEGYFAEAVGNPETERKLKDLLKERPVVEACCYLPMNAAIIAHVFLASNYTLPTTLHGVFVSLILCCIKHHLTKQAEETSISSLNDLPADVGKQVEAISTLAYHGVRESKVTFSTADLKRYHLPTELSTLSLIQGVESFTVLTKSKSYNFLHLSVQELLAAFHISKISPEEQVKIFNELFEEPRFSAVFQFYAAFTKLETEGVRDVVARIVRRGSKLLLLTLLRCLYETRDASLCKFVAAQLNGRLDLSDETISPVDCLSAGYYLNSVCLATSQEIEVNLSNCRVNGYSVSLLCKELSEGSGSHGIPGVGVGQLQINLCNNQLGDQGAIAIASCLKKNQTLKALDLPRCNITHSGATALAKALQENNSLEVLDLFNNQLGDEGSIAIASCLKKNQTLKTLSLTECGVTHSGATALAKALEENNSLEDLNLSGNLLGDDGATRLASALENQTLKTLGLSRCGITDSGATALAKALQENNSLEELNLDQNVIGDPGATSLGDALRVNHSLETLSLVSNRIGDPGATSLGDALRVNKSLKTLRLWTNRISSEKKQELSREFASRIDVY